LTITVRETNPGDILTISNWFFQFYDEVKENNHFGLELFYEKPSLSDEMEWFVEFQKACDQGNAIGIVAEVDGKVAGFCEVNRRSVGRSSSHRGGLGITVKREFRGRGIGSSLLKEMIKLCNGKFEMLELEVFAVNQSAKNLYDKFGFKSYGLRPQSIKRNGEYIDEELMFLRLDKGKV
jgi:ribosomal protein S18 acetylase RimI-like enzyme